MNKAYFILPALTAFTLLYTPVNAQNISQRLDEYFDSVHTDGWMNGNVLIAEDGKIVYKKSFGYADFQNQTPNSDSTLFPLGSISKTFTAIAVLQLKEKGKLHLEDPLSRYLTNFPYPAITISQVLSHTSGLPDDDALLDSLVAKHPEKIFTNADIIPALIDYQRSRNLPFQPGERWSYSSLGYNLLALLVEKLSRQPFATYMRQHIFIPAHMASTYVEASLSQEKDRNRTTNYQYNNHYEMKLLKMDTVGDHKEWTYNTAGLMGAGNVISTALDMLNYDQALYGGILLKQETLAEAYTPVKLNNGQNNSAIPGYSYGLGWFISTDTTRGKIVQHSGALPGVSTMLLRNLTRKQCIIILQNIQASPFIGYNAMDLLNGKPVKYKKSLGFIYGRDLFQKGGDYALTHFVTLKADTATYELKESEMDRVALEMNRNWLKAQTLETLKINTLLFPDSWKAYNNYAAALMKYKQKEGAAMMYQKSLGLNPGNEEAKKALGK
jgi:CubicO group peptidase (beta-lactamase class C family)